ncbi:hypothetical protein [Nocardia sp. NPDC051832]|uniref:hypothetical protein n=1 Tax=Nocardia sp. NPDC051832 TaxID=3155673 RepID=UPI0034202BDC
MKRFAVVLTAAVASAIAAPLVSTATASADFWEPAPGISIWVPDGMFRGLPGIRPSTPPPPPGPPPVEGAPCGDDGRGTWVHLEGGNAAHYGTEWMCRY